MVIQGSFYYICLFLFSVNPSPRSSCVNYWTMNSSPRNGVGRWKEEREGKAPPSLEARTSEPIDISPSILLLCAHVCVRAGRYTREAISFLTIYRVRKRKERGGQERHDKQRKEKKVGGSVV